MNITLLGHRDIASLYALNRIIQSASEHDYTVFLSGALTAKSTPPPQLAGLAAFDATLTDALLDDPTTTPILKSAVDLPAPNSPAGLETLAAAAPDLIVSVRYRRILRDAAIAIPRHGVINLHSGILPDYRGVMATFWAMLNGEAEIGSTLHRIVDAGIDTGPVIEINRQPLEPGVPYLDNVIALYDAGSAAILRAIAALSRGIEPAAMPQVAGSGHYYSTPTAENLESFGANHLILFRNNSAKPL